MKRAGAAAAADGRLVHLLLIGRMEDEELFLVVVAICRCRRRLLRRLVRLSRLARLLRGVLVVAGRGRVVSVVGVVVAVVLVVVGVGVRLVVAVVVADEAELVRRYGAHVRGRVGFGGHLAVYAARVHLLGHYLKADGVARQLADADRLQAVLEQRVLGHSKHNQ